MFARAGLKWGDRGNPLIPNTLHEKVSHGEVPRYAYKTPTTGVLLKSFSKRFLRHTTNAEEHFQKSI